MFHIERFDKVWNLQVIIPQNAELSVHSMNTHNLKYLTSQDSVSIYIFSRNVRSSKQHFFYVFRKVLVQISAVAPSGTSKKSSSFWSDSPQTLQEYFPSSLSDSLCSNQCVGLVSVIKLKSLYIYDNPYPTAFPYGNGMVLHFYQQQESSMTKTVHKVINKGLKTYV